MCKKVEAPQEGEEVDIKGDNTKTDEVKEVVEEKVQPEVKPEDLPENRETNVTHQDHKEEVRDSKVGDVSTISGKGGKKKKSI